MFDVCTVRITSTRKIFSTSNSTSCENISADYAALNYCYFMISYTITLNCKKMHHLRLSPSTSASPSVALILSLIILYLSFVTKVTLTLSQVVKHPPTHLQKKPSTLILPFHSHTIPLRLSPSLLLLLLHTHTHTHTHIDVVIYVYEHIHIHIPTSTLSMFTYT